MLTGAKNENALPAEAASSDGVIIATVPAFISMAERSQQMEQLEQQIEKFGKFIAPGKSKLNLAAAKVAAAAPRAWDEERQERPRGEEDHVISSETSFFSLVKAGFPAEKLLKCFPGEQLQPAPKANSYVKQVAFSEEAAAFCSQSNPNHPHCSSRPR
ncbi:hypothetical protein PAPYR_10584 [Paratrimastix pyriformis]|uniref:Uncharacterized protein n=1 Tax=Paratrimastix pyriformis TaxID=342808 RepID=A0ABQ8U5M4_9EUKA|nr:hypothetical protein PAPYR_10584 [Paratrimastix pyriformis]